MILVHATIVANVNHVVVDIDHVIDTLQTWRQVKLLSFGALHVIP